MPDFEKYEDVPWKDYLNNIISVVISVVIEEGVTSIGDIAFAGCKSLYNVTIRNSVTKIGS